MFDKLDFTVDKYEELAKKFPTRISFPTSDMAEVHEGNGRNGADCEGIQALQGYEAGAGGSKEIFEMEDDEELREMAREEIKELEAGIEKSQEELKILLLPKDPNDEKNVILEVRAGTGGDEAALFGGD